MTGIFSHGYDCKPKIGVAVADHPLLTLDLGSDIEVTGKQEPLLIEAFGQG